MRLETVHGIRKGTAMNFHRTGLVILAAAAAVTVIALTIDDSQIAAIFASPHEPALNNAASAPAVPNDHPTNPPPSTTWGSVFSANWR